MFEGFTIRKIIEDKNCFLNEDNSYGFYDWFMKD